MSIQAPKEERCFFVFKMTINKNSIGQLGERVAANYLKNKGYAILEMNYKNSFGRRIGEIDIVAEDCKARELVFVEVKTRNFSCSETLPEENITFSKLRKLSKIAQDYLRKHQKLDSSYRFDAVSVWIDREGKKARIKHMQSIFL